MWFKLRIYSSIVCYNMLQYCDCVNIPSLGPNSVAFSPTGIRCMHMAWPLLMAWGLKVLTRACGMSCTYSSTTSSLRTDFWYFLIFFDIFDTWHPSRTERSQENCIRFPKTIAAIQDESVVFSEQRTPTQLALGKKTSKTQLPGGVSKALFSCAALRDDNKLT